MQRGEAVERGQAQGIDAADERRVDGAAGQLAGGCGEHLGARRTGGGNDQRGAFQPEILACELCQRERIVGRAVDEIVGQRAGIRIAPAIGQLGLQDAGGAGAEKDADTGPAVTGGRRANFVGKTVSFEPEPRQAVVAAVITGEGVGQFFGVDRGNLADPCIQLHRLESAGSEAAPSFAQAGQQRVAAVAKTGGGGAGTGFRSQ